MQLPQPTKLLSFSGPSAIQVRGHHYPLPLPKYDDNTLTDVTFRKQVQKLYGKEFVLKDIIEQRIVTHPMFARLPVFKTDQPHHDLYTIRGRVLQDPNYSPADLLADIRKIGRHLRFTLRRKGVIHKNDVSKWISHFGSLKRSLQEEISEFEMCPDCIGNYYVFEDPFLIPCRRPHSLVVVCIDETKLLVPAKVISINQRSGQVKVALFDAEGKRLWLKRSDCTLISLRETWHHIWSQDWSQAKGYHRQAFARLFRHLLMLVARFGKWYLGPMSGGKVVSQSTLYAPSDFFADLESGFSEMLYVKRDPDLDDGQVLETKEKKDSKSTLRLDEGTRKRKREIDCRRRKCEEKGGSENWGTECLLCPFRYCSWTCAQKDLKSHVFECSMEKIEADLEYLSNHLLESDSGIAELVDEAVTEGSFMLFGSDDSTELIDCGIEQGSECEDEASISGIGSDDRNDEWAFAEADELMCLELHH